MQRLCGPVWRTGIGITVNIFRASEAYTAGVNHEGQIQPIINAR